MIPTPHTLQVRRRQADQVDRYGNDVESFSAPEPWRVHCWWSSASDASESWSPGRDSATFDFEILSPASPECPSYRDRVVFPDGVEYEVVGVPADYTHGPWPNPAAGVATNVRRVEG